MILKVIEEIAELLLIVASLYLTLSFYIQRYRPAWSKALQDRRFKTLLALILSVTAIKVSEDVLGGESGLIDSNILIFIHSHVANSMNRIFEIVTLTGSSKVLFPLATVTTIIFLNQNHRAEALLLAASVISSACTIYIIKMIVNRSRPILWNTEWYWGSSFPSGHTLAVTAYATAVVLCLDGIKPESRILPSIIATTWVLLVAISRLVLGVHWPTDVLVAICIGAFLPIAISSLFKLSKS
jgi:undecaprenyl-diphosphatase